MDQIMILPIHNRRTLFKSMPSSKFGPYILTYFNPFPFLHPLTTSKNERFSDIFKNIRMEYCAKMSQLNLSFIFRTN